MRVVAALLLALASAATAEEPMERPGARTPVAAQLPARGRDARLTLRAAAVLEVPGGARGVMALGGPARDPTAPQQCPVDWCQPRVDVPGLELSRARVSRSELFATLLDDADLAPLASLVWMVVRTGLELDWRPGSLGGSAASGGGSVMLWLKLRIDASGRPLFPSRERDRGAPRS